MHYSLSLIIFALTSIVYGQGGALPAVTAPNQPSNTDCGGCYIIADIAQVIFADFTTTQTATAIASASVGRNGTLVRTTLLKQLPPFSYNSGGLISGQNVNGSYIPLTGTLLTIAGATLTSPTAYNVFTKYTEFQLTSVADSTGGAGSCATVTSAPVPVSGISYTFADNDGASAILDAESKFIKQIGRLSCAVSGFQVSTTVPIPVATTTMVSSTTGIIAPQPQPVFSVPAASTTAPPFQSSNPTKSSAISSPSIAILTPSGTSPRVTQSIVIGAATPGISHPVFWELSIWLVVGLFAAPGLGAWVL